jgi:hypothetical protein
VPKYIDVRSIFVMDYDKLSVSADYCGKVKSYQCVLGSSGETWETRHFFKAITLGSMDLWMWQSQKKNTVISVEILIFHQGISDNIFPVWRATNCIFWHSWNCASCTCLTRWSVNQQFYSHVPQCLREDVCKSILSQEMAYWTLIFSSQQCSCSLCFVSAYISD